VMLDALMQRGIGKPEEQKQKEEAPPALPTRPTVRGRLPSLQRPGAASPWVRVRPPMPLALLPPPQVSYHHSGLRSKLLQPFIFFEWINWDNND
jgi:hypothetical protein